VGMALNHVLEERTKSKEKVTFSPPKDVYFKLIKNITF
jgi:hypothetical protein